MQIRCLYDELVSVSDLKPSPNNTNKHSKEQIKRLAKILEYQGWRSPIKVSKQTGFITAGHARLEAAKLNKWDLVPINYQDYVDQDQELADITSDNAVAMWAELDLSRVNDAIESFDPSFDLDNLGIQNFTLDAPLFSKEDTKENSQKNPKILKCPHCAGAFEESEAEKIF